MTARGQTLPEPNRSPFLIEDGLAGIPFWMLVEQRAVVAFECEACHHRATWDAAAIEQRFKRHRGKTLASIARRLRCAVCRSEWVVVSRDYRRRSAAGSEIQS